MFNTKRGEIQQRRAERERARLAVLQGEALVQQDVQTALTRLRDAEALVETYRTEMLPALRNTRETLDKLYQQGEPGVDLARVLDIRRRLLKARDASLDALWELSQARADLATALGDPAVAIGAAGSEGPKLP
jgi:outer membrane protein TolC